MKQVSFLGKVAAAVISQFGKTEATMAAAAVAEDKVIGKAVDTMRLAFETAATAKGLTKAQWAALRAPKAAHKVEVTAMFAECVGISDATRRNLATAFWMAFESGEPFSRSAVKDKSEAKKEAKPKTGKVETTDRAALDQTLSKALKQARLLGLTEFAAVMLDHCVDSLDEFKEIEA
jgi:hypothetical protein